MELPIDHFRLLGVSPATDDQNVLRTLQQRLDRAPEQGFTADTLQARAELLRASADLLTDPERRKEYESDLLAVGSNNPSLVPALDVPAPREVAGLLLLLEAGQSQECFSMACRNLQPPQAPALGSSREADLTLLAGLACRSAAEELSRERHFEAAARTLQEGLQLLQRMGQRPEQREAIHRELERLTPYRVLDLLSRDLGSIAERSEGITLLEELVRRRGGLEGSDDPDFSREEFQAFFKQIRGFLTVQEQVDLFSRWGDAGSPTADFLASTALTASGFAQRKPERIAAARTRLQASGRSGIEPLLANLHLLLGDVEAAKHSFEAGADADLRAWVARQSDEPLGRICAWCRDWLARDVLPGYRDLDADADLDAFFSDRDVVAWVEREDRRNGRTSAVATPLERHGRGALGSGPSTTDTLFGGTFASGTTLSGTTAPGSALSGTAGPGSWPEPPDRSATNRAPAREQDDDEGDEEEDVGLFGHLPPWQLPAWPRPLLGWLVGGIAAAGLLLLALSWLLRSRPALPPQGPAAPAATAPRPTPNPGPGANPAPASLPSATSGPVVTPGTGIGRTPGTQGVPAAATGSVAIVSLQAKDPSGEQLRALLEQWLTAKTTVLAGRPLPEGLPRIARESSIDRLENERRDDAARDQSQRIEAQVKELVVSERSPGRIVVKADLAYSDRREDAGGKVLDRTPPTTLRNIYVFGRDGTTWRLAASYAAP